MMNQSDLNLNVHSKSPLPVDSVVLPKSKKLEIPEIVTAITKSKIAEFAPRLSDNDNGVIVYPEASQIIGVEGSDVRDILEELCQENILVREPASLSCRCPTCNAESAALSLICPNCGGTDLMSGTALQHLPCLLFDFESNFTRGEGNSLYCPRCDRKLEVLGSDYIAPGTFFKCGACGEFTARAKRLYSCPSCQQVFETAKEPPIEAYKYRVRSSLDLKSHSIDVSALIDELRKAGLDATRDASIKGVSGSSHQFSLIVTKSAGGRGKSTDCCIAVDMVFGTTQVDPSRVFALFAKSIDCGIARRVLVAVPEISRQTKLLAESYDIYVLESQNTADAGGLLYEHITSVLAGRKAAPRIKRAAKRRGSIDIMADILSIATSPSSKSEIISCANLSFEQCQRYLGMLERMGLLARYLEDAVRVRYVITEKGREYMTSLSGEFGRIAEGDKSIWGTRRRLAQSLTK